MTFRSIALGSAAAIALAGAAFASEATVSHDAEVQQTRNLNLEQLSIARGDQTAQAPDSIGLAGENEMSMGEATPPDAYPTEPVEEIAQNETPPAEGEDAGAAESPDMSAGAEATGEASQHIALDALKRPAEELETARLENEGGEPIGTVQKVTLDADGTPEKVDVEIGGFLGVGSKIVSIDANQLSYDEQDNAVVTSLTAQDLKALPETDSGS